MLIKHTPDAYEKLQILGGMAGDDILSRPEGGGTGKVPRGGPIPNPRRTLSQASIGRPCPMGSTST